MSFDRRSELRRTTRLASGDTPLARSPFLPRTSPLPRASFPSGLSRGAGGTGRAETPRSSGSTIAPKQRATAYERDGHRCVCCGCLVQAGNRQLQHRVARQAGGKRRNHDRLSALITCCGVLSTDNSCHARMEANPDWAREQGYRVEMSGDPLVVPVRYHDGWWLLDDDGDRAPWQGAA